MEPPVDVWTDCLEAMRDTVAEINIIKGWHDIPRSFGEDVALLHSEVSEMLEAYRLSGVEEGKYEISFEVADVFIRLLDVCYRWDIDLPFYFMKKLEINKTRPLRHGNKVL